MDDIDPLPIIDTKIGTLEPSLFPILKLPIRFIQKTKEIQLIKE